MSRAMPSALAVPYPAPAATDTPGMGAFPRHFRIVRET